MKRPTIKDVAKRAGVSYQTVSRVINHSQRVHPETKNQVEKVIEELGYRPSSIARSMVRGKTYTMGCISPNLTDFVFAKIIDSAQMEARRRGFILLTASAQSNLEVKYLVEEMMERRVDGLMIINPRENHSFRHLRPLLNNDIPVVIVKDQPGKMPVSSVTCDGFQGAVEATQYLLSRGHTAVATITGLKTDTDAEERLQGYLKAMEEAGLTKMPELIVQGDWTERSGKRAAERLLAASVPFSAIFVQNDRMAMGAMHACNRAGKKVPEDVSLIGFDNAPFAAYLNPPLTTMLQPMDKLGQHAARLLSAAIQAPEFSLQNVRVTPELVERESCLSLSL